MPAWEIVLIVLGGLVALYLLLAIVFVVIAALFTKKAHDSMQRDFDHWRLSRRPRR